MKIRSGGIISDPESMTNSHIKKHTYVLLVEESVGSHSDMGSLRAPTPQFVQTRLIPETSDRLD